MNEPVEKPFYSPAEVAEMLHVSVDQLRQMRWQGRIKGTRIGNSTVYTWNQIQAADLKPWPRGRRSKVKKSAVAGDGVASDFPFRCSWNSANLSSGGEAA